MAATTDYWAGKEDVAAKYSSLLNTAPAPVAPVAPTGSGRTFGGIVGDGVATVGGAVLEAGKAAVGLADLATLGKAGKFLEDTIGYKPEEARQILRTELYSDAQKVAQAKVDAAQGFFGKARAMIDYPSTLLTGTVESLPSIALGGALAKGATAARLLPKALSAASRGAVGEGLVMAGSAAEEIRQQTDDRELTLGQAGLALGTGIVGAGISKLGGGIADKFGLDDIDILAAGGSLPARSAGLAKRLIGGGIVEGGEELLQSAEETIAQNLALGRPAMEGVPEAAAQGALLGSTMGTATPTIRTATDAVQQRLLEREFYDTIITPKNMAEFDRAKVRTARTAAMEYVAARRAADPDAIITNKDILGALGYADNANAEADAYMAAILTRKAELDAQKPIDDLMTAYPHGVTFTRTEAGITATTTDGKLTLTAADPQAFIDGAYAEQLQQATNTSALNTLNASVAGTNTTFTWDAEQPKKGAPSQVVVTTKQDNGDTASIRMPLADALKQYAPESPVAPTEQAAETEPTGPSRTADLEKLFPFGVTFEATDTGFRATTATGAVYDAATKEEFLLGETGKRLRLATNIDQIQSLNEEAAGTGVTFQFDPPKAGKAPTHVSVITDLGGVKETIKGIPLAKAADYIPSKPEPAVETETTPTPAAAEGLGGLPATEAAPSEPEVVPPRAEPLGLGFTPTGPGEVVAPSAVEEADTGGLTPEEISQSRAKVNTKPFTPEQVGRAQTMVAPASQPWVEFYAGQSRADLTTLRTDLAKGGKPADNAKLIAVEALLAQPKSSEEVQAETNASLEAAAAAKTQLDANAAAAPKNGMAGQADKEASGFVDFYATTPEGIPRTLDELVAIREQVAATAPTKMLASFRGATTYTGSIKDAGLFKQTALRSLDALIAANTTYAPKMPAGNTPMDLPEITPAGPARTVKTAFLRRSAAGRAQVAYVDTQTGMLSPLALSDYEAQHGQDVGWVTLSFDSLKAFNDSMSHGAANEAVTLAGQAVKGAADKLGFLAFRKGGDFFVAVPKGQEAAVAKQIEAAANQTVGTLEVKADAKGEGISYKGAYYPPGHYNAINIRAGYGDTSKGAADAFGNEKKRLEDPAQLLPGETLKPNREEFPDSFKAGPTTQRVSPAVAPATIPDSLAATLTTMDDEAIFTHVFMDKLTGHYGHAAYAGLYAERVAQYGAENVDVSSDDAPGLRDVNLKYGEDGGDKFLKGVGAIYTRVKNDSGADIDIIHMSGDEFATIGSKEEIAKFEKELARRLESAKIRIKGEFIPLNFIWREKGPTYDAADAVLAKRKNYIKFLADVGPSGPSETRLVRAARAAAELRARDEDRVSSGGRSDLRGHHTLASIQALIQADLKARGLTQEQFDAWGRGETVTLTPTPSTSTPTGKPATIIRKKAAAPAAAPRLKISERIAQIFVAGKAAGQTYSQIEDAIEEEYAPQGTAVLTAAMNAAVKQAKITFPELYGPGQASRTPRTPRTEAVQSAQERDAAVLASLRDTSTHVAAPDADRAAFQKNIEEITGIKVQFVSSIPGNVQGYVHPSIPDTVFVSTQNTDAVRTINYVAGHEIWHLLEAQMEPAMLDRIVKAMGDTGTLTQDLLDLHNPINPATGERILTEEQFQQEFRADLGAVFIQSPEFWNQLRQRMAGKNPSLLSQVLTSVKNLINRVLMGTDPLSPLYAQIRETRAMIETELATHLKGRKGGVGMSQRGKSETGQASPNRVVKQAVRDIIAEAASDKKKDGAPIELSKMDSPPGGNNVKPTLYSSPIRRETFARTLFDDAATIPIQRFGAWLRERISTPGGRYEFNDLRDALTALGYPVATSNDLHAAVQAELVKEQYPPPVEPSAEPQVGQASPVRIPRPTSAQEIGQASAKAATLLREKAAELKNTSGDSVSFKAFKLATAVAPMQTLIDVAGIVLGKEFAAKMSAYHDLSNAYSRARTSPIDEWKSNISAQIESLKPDQRQALNTAAHGISFLQQTPWADKNNSDWADQDVRGLFAGEESARRNWIAAGMQEKTKSSEHPNGLDFNMAHSIALQMYRTMNPETQEIYRKAVRAIHANRTAEIDAARRQLVEVGGNTEAIQKMLAQLNLGFSSLKGAYWPLSRFGEYTLSVTNIGPDGKKAGETALFRAYESKSERDAALLQLRTEYAGAIKEGKVRVSASSKAEHAAQKAVPLQFVAQIEDAMKGKMDPEQLETLKDALGNLWLQWQPESSAMRSLATRKNIIGFNDDALRTATQYIISHANRTATMLYEKRLSDSLDEMEMDAQNIGHTGDPDFALHTVRNLRDRRKATEGDKVNSVVSTASKMSSIWFLSSPSTTLVQMTQPYTVGLPKLATMFGFGKSLSALARANKDAISGPEFELDKLVKMTESVDVNGVPTTPVGKIFRLLTKKQGSAEAEASRGDGRGFLSIGDLVLDPKDRWKLFDPKERSTVLAKMKLSPKEQAAYNVQLTPQEIRQVMVRLAMHDDHISISAVNEAQDIAGGRESKLGVTKFALYFMKKGEEFSRVTTMLAAFDLASTKGMKAGGDFDSAYNSAISVARDTLFDYRKEAKPVILQNQYMRLFTQFRYFQLSLLTRVGMLTMKAISSSVDPKERAQAGKELAYMMGTTTALGGLAGMPVYSAAAGISELVQQMLFSLGVGDEPPEDAEIETYKALEAGLGKPAADALMGGMFNTLGWSASQRVGASGAFDLLGDAPARVEGGNYFDYLMTQNMGPSYTLAKNFFIGANQMSEGDTLQGLSTMMPKLIKDYGKALQTAQDGATGVGGRTLISAENITPTELILMAHGFTPTRIADSKQRDRALDALSLGIQKRKTAMAQKAAKAFHSGDTAEFQQVLGEIQGFVERNPLVGYPDVAGQIRDMALDRRGQPGRRAMAMRQLYAGYAQEDNEFSNAE